VIQVSVEDLALTQADAVLRPTDESLGALTEVISRLDQQAGPRFAEQRRLSSPLKAGAAVVTGSGDLPAPFVLHVVIRDADSGVAREVVRRGLQSAWQRAADWELGVIAAPLVGAGADRDLPAGGHRMPVRAPHRRGARRRSRAGRGHRPEDRVIRLNHLTKCYGKFTAVDNIDLVIPSGELFGFLGPNGAGKTTTFRMIAGILRPTSGSVEIGGIDVAQRPLEAKARLGFIPDRPFVYDKLTGGEFLRFAAALYGQQGPAVERRIDELLELFELDRWKDELTESYSHGMRQKLIISGALVHRPEVIVVDEPMVGLDPKSARLLKDLFRQFVDRGGTVLMSTHTLEVAETMCDRIAILHGGKIVANGTLAEVQAQTASEDLGLEELFLKLTGGMRDQQLDTILDS
jgi:ABC-2 type transport system ATP-binding protein